MLAIRRQCYNAAYRRDSNEGRVCNRFGQCQLGATKLDRHFRFSFQNACPERHGKHRRRCYCNILIMINSKKLLYYKKRAYSIAISGAQIEVAGTTISVKLANRIGFHAKRWSVQVYESTNMLRSLFTMLHLSLCTN